MTAADIAIVGGGVAGLATAWALAEAGARDVVLLERGTRLAAESSGLNAGILRSASDPAATRRLALATGRLLREPPASLAAHADGPLLDPRGLVIVEGRPDLPEPRWVAALTEQNEVQPLPLPELASLVPAFRPEGGRAWRLPREGRIPIARLCTALADAARAQGVTLRTGSAVRAIETDAAGRATGVRLADGEALQARRVVLAPGGGSAALAATCGARFPGRATRRHLYVTRAHGHIDTDWPVVWDDAAGFYLRPEGDGLMVCLCDQDDVDPEALFVDPLVARAMRRRLRESLPGLDGLDLERGWCGVRTVTEDDQPVVGHDPDVPGLFWVAALGGHGMSVSLAVGRLAAALLTETPVEATALLDEDLARAVAPDNAERDYEPLRDWRAL